MLASLLRECASIVERNETSPLLFKAVESLNAYATRNETNNETSVPTPSSLKPAFQRPINKSSNLIANGWIEQQRRSSLRMVWKKILTSLVEARRAGEDTTLWIQREVMKKDPDGQMSTTLEALHQIPMKWLLNVRYLDDYGDFRFCLRVYNVPDEFVFRTPDEDSCKEWVATLTSAKDASKSNHAFTEAAFPDLLSSDQNGNGNNGVAKTTSNDDTVATSSTTGKNNDLFPDVDLQKPDASTSTSPTSSPTKPKKKRPLKELIAIAHGAGYNTRGMERADLEKIAEHFAPASERTAQQQKQQQPSATSSNHTNGVHNNNMNAEAERRRRMQEQQAARAFDAEEQKRKEVEEQKRKEVEEQKRKEVEDEKIRQQIEDMRLKQDEMRRQRAKEVSDRIERQRMEAEAAAKKAAVEAARIEEEQRRSRQQRSQNAQRWEKPWQQQQQQQGQNHTQTNGNASHPNNNQHRPSHQYNPQQQQQHNHYQRQPAATAPPNQQQQPPPDPTSPINQKYGKQMSSATLASEQDEQTAITNIKRNILVSWALIPPNFNMLKPIDQLLSSIHEVLPPFGGVKYHDYFKRWKAVNRDEVTLGSAMGHAPDETKLKKVHRKLKVFLHPDRLPKEFDVKQKFVCKMLWDVSNDALEEFLKNREDLDWVNK